MGSIKQMLRESIEALSDEEAEYLLVIAKKLISRKMVKKASGTEVAFDDIRFPASPPSFETVEPLRGHGKPASELLIEDRR